jgi:hypothetical protein
MMGVFHEGLSMKFGLLAHMNSVNLGDHVQSLAARQFLPRVDCIVEREHLHEAANAGPIKVIMNGWWMKHPERWPPPPNIIPLFVSFHITTGPAREAMLMESSLEYLRKHEPIGCRDLSTMEFLRDAGIDSYFSGCLTMTFPRRQRETAGEALFVDAFRDHFFESPQTAQRDPEGKLWAHHAADRVGERRRIPDHKLLARIGGMPEDWCTAARQASAVINRDTSHDTKFVQATSLLEQYANAKVIVTSRLHAVLPATAMGVPCMFVFKDEPSMGAAVGNRSDQGHDCTRHDPRLSGLVDHTQHVTLSRLLDGLPAAQWVKLAAESPCHEPGIVTSLSTRVRDFVGE